MRVAGIERVPDNESGPTAAARSRQPWTHIDLAQLILLQREAPFDRESVREKCFPFCEKRNLLTQHAGLRANSRARSVSRERFCSVIFSQPETPANRGHRR